MGNADGEFLSLADTVAAVRRELSSAQAASREAADTYPELAAARPDAFRPDLATALINLATDLAALGRREVALAAIQEAATIRRELATRWPDIYRHELEQSFQIAAWLERERRAAGE